MLPLEYSCLPPTLPNFACLRPAGPAALLRAFLCLLLLLGWGMVRAELTVNVVLSEGGGPYAEYYEALSTRLNRLRPDARIRRLELNELDTLDTANARANLLIAVGNRACNALSALPTGHAPILAVLLTRRNFEEIARRNERRPSSDYSAIYLDQPLERQLALIRHTLPEARRVAVLLGPESSALLPELQDSARRLQLELRTGQAEQIAEIVPTLNRLLPGSELLLALPDPLAYSRDTAHPVLLTAYRHQKPVFAFSRAYVTAGALAAVFSTPDDIARQTAELLATLPSNRLALPPPSPPSHHSVSTNPNVARSLGLNIPSEEVLRARLQSGAKEAQP